MIPLWPYDLTTAMLPIMDDAYHLACVLLRAGLCHERSRLVGPLRNAAPPSAITLPCVECGTDIDPDELAVLIPVAVRVPESFLSRDQLLDLRTTMSKLEIADEYGVPVSEVEAVLES